MNTVDARFPPRNDSSKAQPGDQTDSPTRDDCDIHNAAPPHHKTPVAPFVRFNAAVSPVLKTVAPKPPPGVAMISASVHPSPPDRGADLARAVRQRHNSTS